MTENQRLDFFKQYIKEKLEKLKEDIPARRYKLLLAVIDDCDDYNELREMAELDMQIDLFEYTKTEISPKMEQLNIEMNELRESQSTYTVQSKPSDSGPIEYTTEDMLTDMDDPEMDAAMAALLAARLQTEPLEETYRDEMLDGVNDIKPSISDLDNLGEELDDFGDVGDATDISDSDFGDLGDLEDELEDTDEGEQKSDSESDDFFEDDDPFSDFDNKPKKPKDEEDDFFESEDDEEQESNGADNIDGIDLGEEYVEDSTKFIEDGDFEQAFGDMLNEISATNPLFEDTGEEDPDDLELSAMLGLDSDDSEDSDQDTFDSIDFDNDILGDIEDSEDDTEDNLDSADFDSELDAFGDFEGDDEVTDTEDGDGLDSLDLGDEFDDSDDTDGDSELPDNMDFDPADFGDFPDADDLFGGDSSKDNKPIEQEDDSNIDDDLLSAFGDTDELDEDTSGDEEDDPFSSLGSIEDSGDDDDGFGDLLGDDSSDDLSDDSSDGLDELSDDLFGVEDDSDDFFRSQEDSSRKTAQSGTAVNQQRKVEQPSKEISVATIFANGSKHGNETQKMFNTILKVGSLFGKAQATATKQVKRGIQSGTRSMQQSGLFSLKENE